MLTKNELIEKVLCPIEKAGFKAYFVGGCVRDSLLGTKPHDFDICTDATPDELKQIFPKISSMSKNAEPFGVTMPVVKGELIEIATARRDITKGRHPTIEFTKDFEEDAKRRDFTINALYEDSEGKIIDFVGGKVDIETKTLRFVGEMKERLSEDPLRLFRAIRFMSKLGFTPDFTADELTEVAFELFDEGRFSEVSKERILKELEGIFAGRFFIDIFEDFFFMSPIPEIIGLRSIISNLKLVKQSFRWHAEGAVISTDNGNVFVYSAEDLKGFKGLVTNGDAFTHTFNVMREMEIRINKVNIDDHKRFLMMMSALLHDCGKYNAMMKGQMKTNEFEINGIKVKETIPRVASHDIDGVEPAEAFCKSIGLTNKDTYFICRMVENHMRMHQIPEMKSPAKIWKFVSNPNFWALTMLAESDESGCIKTVSDEWCGILNSLEKEVTIKFPEVGTYKIKDLAKMPLPKPILSGDDLVAFGKKPGPLFKKMIDKAFEFQINDGITDKQKLFNNVKGITLGKQDK